MRAQDADVLHIRRDRRDNLDISRDTDFDDEPLAVFLFTPDMENTAEHHHIELDVPRARDLHEWLGRFLRDNGEIHFGFDSRRVHGRIELTMSHYTVTVRITPERLAKAGGDVKVALAEIIAPYEESPGKGSPYLVFQDEEDELLKTWEERKAKGEDKHRSLDAFAADWSGAKRDKATGRLGTYGNPNAKWDWYTIGGRWRGYFPVKPGTDKIVGQPGVFDNKPGEGADVVRRRDLDLDSAARGEAEDFEKFKADYRAWLAGTYQKKDHWDEGPRSQALDAGLLRIEHDPKAQLAPGEVVIGNATWGELHPHIAKETGEGGRAFWRDVARDISDAEFERYRSIFNPLRTYAALDDSGWNEPGEMGWWGMARHTPDSYLAYCDGFVERVIKAAGPDDLLVLVDCHI